MTRLRAAPGSEDRTEVAMELGLKSREIALPALNAPVLVPFTVVKSPKGAGVRVSSDLLDRQFEARYQE